MARILVVDDDPDIRKILHAILAASGHDALCADGAVEAGKVLEGHHMDAAIIDIMMPEISGYDLLETMRGAPETRDVPVILLSALGGSQDKVKGLRFGCDDYITKPFDAEELLLRVERLIERSTPPSNLTGDLQQYPMLELLQSLEQAERSGWIEVTLENGQRGEIALSRGRMTEARLRRLRAEEAVIAMMCLEKGSFSFVPGEVEVTDAIPLANLAMQRSFLLDELERRESVSPGRQEPLRTFGHEPRKAEDHLARQLFARIRALDGITSGELMSQDLAAPLRVELVIAKLVEEGFVTILAPQESRSLLEDRDA